MKQLAPRTGRTLGPTDAFAALVREHTRYVTLQLARRGVAPYDAEDVAQEAAVRAYRSFASLRNRDRFRGWLVRIAWRLAIDRRRSEQRREARESAAWDEPSPSRTAEDLAAARQTQERVFRALDALPESLRIVVVLAAIEGHGMREVATLLGLPEGTVKSRLHDARRRLGETLR